MHNVITQLRSDRTNRPNEKYVPVAGKAVDEFLPTFDGVVAENAALKRTVADRDTEIVNLRKKIDELSEKVKELASAE